MTDISNLLSRFSADFNARLDDFFPLSDKPENRVIEAMKYSVTNGGKRLRPFLVCTSARLFGLDFEASLRPAVALECLHSYSLIHDDLPAMDNDDLRRGKPTCHKAFDEATAILAGDGLLTYAFEILSSPATHADAAVRSELCLLLAEAAGAFNGMVSGQMLDLYMETHQKAGSEEIIRRIEEMKTGRLIRYACEAGAVLGRAAPDQRQALISYARGIGVAFQIADDILDVEGSPELVGKTLQKDSAQGKVTFVSLFGLETARQMAGDYIAGAKRALSIFPAGEEIEILQNLADFIINRRY